MKKTPFYLPVVFSILLIAGIVLGYCLHDRTGRIGFGLSGDNYDKFNDVMNYIDREYVDTINHDRLVEEGIMGVLKALDPHSQYISSENIKEVNDPLEGNYDGIGVEFRIVEDTIVVIRTIPGGPSQLAGVLAGDRVVTIEGRKATGTSITDKDAIRQLKGKRGTQVTIGIHRRGIKNLLDFTITRDKINTYSLDYYNVDTSGIGFIKLSRFSATTHQELADALTDMVNKGMKKLILDLRGNEGGYLVQATETADEFLAKGKLIVYTEGRSSPRKYYTATASGAFEEGPLAVLIDEGTASAGEILAGAIQDNDRGVIIGRRSFGKGLVQSELSLPDGSAVRLTVARYYTPTGRCIQRPYDEGYESYYRETYERLNNGGEDSSLRTQGKKDTLKFMTPGGKVVYGGGGILPDSIVPASPDKNLGFYYRLNNGGIIYRFAFDYADKNRDRLAVYRTAQDFTDKYEISPSIYHSLIIFAESKGLKPGMEIPERAGQHIRTALKAYIGLILFDYQGYYPVYNLIDKTYQVAMRSLEKK
jgi:carboxyl-terminal processing protease